MVTPNSKCGAAFLLHRTVPGTMPEVLIRYCLPCRYQPQAMQDADAILKEFGPELSGLRLGPGDQSSVMFSLRRAAAMERRRRAPHGLVRRFRSWRATAKAGRQAVTPAD